MKKIHSLLLFCLVFSSAFAQKNKNNAKQPPSTNKIIWVNAYKSPCNAGELQKDCFMVKKNLKQSEWFAFSDEIAGFKHEEGFEYELLVKTQKIKNPQADASDTKYSLVKILSKTPKTTGLKLSNQWIISSFGDGANGVATKSAYITINQGKKTFSGSGSCNRINGMVSVVGQSIKFEKIAATRMMCGEMEQETKFIAALERATSFKIKGCEMFLYQGNELILTLESCR